MSIAESTWGLSKAILDSMKRETNIKQAIAEMEAEQRTLRATRHSMEMALLKKIRLSGGVLMAHSYAFWSNTGDQLEIAPARQTFDVDRLVGEVEAEPIDDGQPESFAEAVVTEMSGV